MVLPNLSGILIMTHFIYKEIMNNLNTVYTIVVIVNKYPDDVSPSPSVVKHYELFNFFTGFNIMLI